MDITFAGRAFHFRPWKPDLGRVFTKTYAFDCETARLDEARPWLTPPYVLGAACDRERGYFVARKHAAAFLAAHADVPVAMHHAPFDLAVLDVLAPGLDVYARVDADRVWDTQLLHRLYRLATAGHTAGGKGQSTLERCAELYLGVALPKDVVDARGNPVRTSYGQWLNRDPREIEPVYLEYLAQDVVVTCQLYRRLRRLLEEALRAGAGAWGYVSDAWLLEQMRRWGPATHHIQLKAAIVLQAITANGLHLDQDHRAAVRDDLGAVAEELRATLHAHGYIPGKGSDRALQAILRRLEGRHRGHAFPRTPTGKYATSRAALEDLAAAEPFVRALLDYHAVTKLRSSFLDRMAAPVLHPSFDVLKVTGRTSSFGQINAQNLPRDDRVRRCVVPRPGSTFLILDYSAIEMVSLGQALPSQFGLESALAAALNAGADPHRIVAALAVGKAEADVTKEERRKAKPINFGKPGAMGHETLKAYARASYNGLVLTDDEVHRLSDAWRRRFPEMDAFLAGEKDLGLEVARVFGLTPHAHAEHTGTDRYLRRCAPSEERRTAGFLGGMFLKAIKAPAPTTRDGRPYDAETVDYFWSRLEARLDLLPSKHREAARHRRPSAALQKSVMSAVDREPVWTLTGRLRARATFAARHNNIFQGLAADGAKLALWEAWRAGYRIVNFIHDELLVEVPADSDLDAHARRLGDLMVAGMRAVVPDVRIAVEDAAATAWSKEAERVTDADGRLVAWTPAATEAPAVATAPTTR